MELGVVGGQPGGGCSVGVAGGRLLLDWWGTGCQCRGEDGGIGEGVY